MGRTSTARERLLDAACELMQARSYGTVGVAEVCARADVRKGSFYHFFPSKQALTLAAIDTHWGRQREDWVGVLGARRRDPLRRLERLFTVTADTQRAALAATGSLPGCPLANLALELSGE